MNIHRMVKRDAENEIYLDIEDRLRKIFPIESRDAFEVLFREWLVSHDETSPVLVELCQSVKHRDATGIKLSTKKLEAFARRMLKETVAA